MYLQDFVILDHQKCIHSYNGTHNDVWVKISKDYFVNSENSYEECYTSKKYFDLDESCKRKSIKESVTFSDCKSKKGKYVKEDIDEIEISSDDMEIKVKPKDEECEECKEETVSPVSEETIDEIEINNVYKDMVDEVTEECLKENFNNVKFFRSNNITKRNNKLIVEGVIGFKSGKKKNTKFMFESYKTNRDKVVFLGENKDVTKNKSLSLVGKVVRDKFIPESMKLK